MAANTNPIFTLTPIIWTAFTTAANTAKDGSGTLVSLGQGGTSGTRIDVIQFIASTPGQTTANTAGVARAFIGATAGATHYLVGEVTLPATTPSASATGVNSSIYFSPALILPSGWDLSVTQSVFTAGATGDKLAVIARGGSFE